MKIIIIGGGVAGLSSGIYARCCGFETLIFESGNKAGGVCSYWKKGSFIMSMSIRMLIGCKPENPLYNLLDETGIISGTKISEMDRYHCIEDEFGERIIFYRNPSRLYEQLANVAPSDKERIKRFMGILEDFGRFSPPVDVSPKFAFFKDSIIAMKKLKPVAKHLISNWNKSVRNWVDQFDSDIFKRTFLKLYPNKDFPVIAMFTVMGWFQAGHIGYPLTGSKGIVDALLKKYNEVGGKIYTNHTVEEIIVDSGKATAVRLADGSIHQADIIISAADGYSTIFKFLGGKFINSRIKDYYNGKLQLFTPLVTLHLGIEGDINEENNFLHLPVKKSINACGTIHKNLNLHIIRNEGELTPQGHSLIRLGVESPYEAWEKLAENPDSYHSEKKRLAMEIVERLDERYPGFGSKIKIVDVATPLTLVRYTKNWKGSYEGWLPTTKTFGLKINQTLPGLKNFYMAGQWVEPGGGIPGVIRNARNTVRLICKDFSKKFIAN